MDDPLDHPSSTYIQTPSNTTHELRLLQWNCRSLNANKESLDDLISKFFPDIILLTETWLKPNQNFYLKNFKIIRCDRPDGYGGSAILIHKNIPFSLINSPELTADNNVSISISAAKILLPSFQFSIYSVYIPPSANISILSFETFFDHFNGNFVIGGDFNAKSPLWGCNNYNTLGSNLEEALTSSHEICLLNDQSPTHFTNSQTNFSALDLTFCSPLLHYYMQWHIIDDPHGSDHLPILTKVCTPQLKLPQKTSPNRINIKNINWNTFHLSLDQKFQSFDLETDPLTQYQNFVNCILETLKEQKQNSSTSYSHKKSFNSPIWWNENCTKASKERQTAYKLFLQTRSSENFVNLRKINAKTRYTFKNSKKQSFRKFCTTFNRQSDLKQIWNKTKAFRNPLLFTQSSTPSEEQIQTFISSIAPDYVPTNEEIYPKIDPIKLPSTTHPLLQPFLFDEFSLVLQKKKPNSAPGPDLISYDILKHLSKLHLKLLLQILNSLWSNSLIPSSWLIFRIIPIPKKKSQ